MIKRRYYIFPLVLLLAISCNNRLVEDLQDERTLLFSLDTKSLGTGEYTYRAALINLTSAAFMAEGTYCNTIIDHSLTVPYRDGKWLSPCKVDDNGLPLKADGTEASGLAQADMDRSYGLRYGERVQNGVYLVAASPAVAFSVDGSLRYYPWTPSSELSISDPAIVTHSGTFLSGQFIFNSEDELTLINRRARISIHIECGESDYAYIQRVRLINCVTSARWYLTTGFSAENVVHDGSYVLYDCNGSPLLIEKNTDHSYWASTAPVYLPPMNFSSNDFASCRPRIEVLMGNNTSNPTSALVTLSQDMDARKDYSFYLRVSKTNVSVSLAASDWETDDPVNSEDAGTPSDIGSFALTDSWTDNGVSSTDPWYDPS